MKNLDEYLEEYLDHLKSEKGCTPSTIRGYRYDLLFLKKMLPDKNIEALSVRDIRVSVNKLANPPYNYKERARARKINALRGFFKYLFESEIIEKNPTIIIKTPKIPDEKKEVISPEEFITICEFYENKYEPKIKMIEKRLKHLQKLFDKESNPNKKESYLERIKKNQEWKIELENRRDDSTLIVRTLYSTMCRNIELIRMQVKDIDFEHGIVMLRGKGKKQRDMELDQTTIDLMQKIIARKNMDRNDFVFQTPEGEPYQSNNAIEYRIRTIRKALKMDYPLTPHKFRRNAGSHLSWKGMPLEDLQDLLGHSSPQTTRIYVQSNPEKRKRFYQNHPLITRNKERNPESENIKQKKRGRKRKH